MHYNVERLGQGVGPERALTRGPSLILPSTAGGRGEEEAQTALTPGPSPNGRGEIRLDEAAIRREMDIYGRLREIASPHILVVLDILREAGEYALVTEYADSGSLWDLLGGDEATDDIRKPLDETTVRTIEEWRKDGVLRGIKLDPLLRFYWPAVVFWLMANHLDPEATSDAGPAESASTNRAK